MQESARGFCRVRCDALRDLLHNTKEEHQQTVIDSLMRVAAATMPAAQAAAKYCLTPIGLRSLESRVTNYRAFLNFADIKAMSLVERTDALDLEDSPLRMSRAWFW